MAASSVERELEEFLAELQPTTRYQDLAVWFRRLTVESTIDIPEDAALIAGDGTIVRCRRAGEVVAACSDPPGQSVQLEDGAALTWSGGVARLRVEVLARFGGRWDHRERRFAAAQPKLPLVLDVQEAQVEFVRWFVGRWQAFKAHRRHEHALAVLIDDRGGGKTWIVLMLLLAAMIEFPRHPDGAEFVLWFVSVNQPARRELDREIRKWLPPAWYRFKEWPLHQLFMVNGGVIELMSADNPEALRQGRVDVVWENEGAKLSSDPLENAIGRVKDRWGFGVVTSNPPTAACAKGAWVEALYENHRDAEEAGEKNPVVFLRCSSKLNPLQDREVGEGVAIVLRWLNPERAQADAEGLILPVGEYAYRPPFSARDHVIEISEETAASWAARDITRQLTLQRCGTAYDWIIGADFQSRPAMVAVPMKVYDSPDLPTILVWSSFWVEGDEDDLITAVEEDLEWIELNRAAQRQATPRFTRNNTVYIGDPSGTWQDGQHNPGKDSFSVFRARQWRILPPMRPRDPEKKPPHPPVHLRVGRMNGLIAEKRLLVAKNKTTEPLVHSLKNCRTARHGFRSIPKPGSRETHLPDALGYPVWWIIPRYQPNPSARPVARSLGAGWRS